MSLTPNPDPDCDPHPNPHTDPNPALTGSDPHPDLSPDPRPVLSYAGTLSRSIQRRAGGYRVAGPNRYTAQYNSCIVTI